jgi:hypothetical protein
MDFAQPVPIRPRWLRTLEAPAASRNVLWLGTSIDDQADCASTQVSARCWFVPIATGGVVASPDYTGLKFAVVPPGQLQEVPTWRTAAWGRLIRVRAPSGAQVGARIVAMQPTLRNGSGQMREATAVSGITVHSLGSNVFWLEGGKANDAELELRAAGAATTRVPITRLATSFPSATGIALPAEARISGDVRSPGSPVQGATVMIVRLLEPPSPRTSKEPPVERIGEIITGPAGSFAFGGLDHGRYELFGWHPSHGRARAVVSPPSHVRLELRPRPLVRGRVLQDGVPLASALVRALPSIEAVASARNPAFLASESLRTGPTGRFEVLAPDEGHVVLSIAGQRASRRIDLGDGSTLADALDVGDVELGEPIDLDVVADLPPGCELHAAGPIGTTGLSVVRSTFIGPGRWRLKPPLAGRWLVGAVCGGKELALDPQMVQLPLERRGPVFLKVRR